MLRDCVIIGYPSTFIMRARHTERQAIPLKVLCGVSYREWTTVSFPLISLILPGIRLKSKTNIDIVIFEHFVRLRTIISPERPSRLVRGRTIGERSVNQRHETIRNLLAERGRLAVDDLAVELGVTPMTIRRDFTALEKAGLLTRTHGGVCLAVGVRAGGPVFPPRSGSNNGRRWPLPKRSSHSFSRE